MMAHDSVSNIKDIIINNVKDALAEAEFRSYKLILVVLETKVRLSLILELKNSGIEFLNVSKLLSQRLVCLSVKERIRRLESEFASIVDEGQEKMWLANLNLLFDPSLNIDPIILLKWLSKSRTVVAIWPGKIYGTSLVYAEPGFEDYRSYSLQELNDIQIVNLYSGVVK